MITLYDSVSEETIDLPSDLFWSDEFDWTTVAATSERTLTGVLIVEESVKQAGRPITLEGSDDMAWVTRETVLALQAWCNQANKTFTLTLPDTRAFTVKFDNIQGAISAAPVLSWKQSDNDDWYTITLKFLEV